MSQGHTEGTMGGIGAEREVKVIQIRYPSINCLKKERNTNMHIHIYVYRYIYMHKYIHLNCADENKFIVFKQFHNVWLAVSYTL